jgi:ribose transport system substrate-binding protein
MRMGATKVTSNRSTFCAIATAVAVALGLAACGSDDDSASGADKAHSVAMVTPTLDDFSHTVQLGAQEAADELGVDFDHQPAPNYEPEAEVRVLNAAAARRPDAIILSAIDANALRAPAEAAARRGIKVVTFDANVQDPTFVETFVGNDYVKSGRLIAEELDRLIDGPGKTLFIAANPGNAFTDALLEGYETALASTDLESLPVQHIDGWDTAKTNAVVKATLTKEPDLAGIFVGGLTAAQGALPAIRAAGQASDLATVEFDGTPEGIQHLERGQVDAIISSPARDYGAESVRAAVQVLNGKRLPPEQFLPACVLTKQTIDDPENQPCIYEKVP